MYADLAFVADKIKYKLDSKLQFWWAQYDNLSAKELKQILRARGQQTSGVKQTLISRLYAGDRRRLALLQTSGKMGKTSSHEEVIQNLINRSSTHR